MNKSENINELAAALSKAQGSIKGALKASENPFFKKDGHGTKYADLSSVWDACREPLSVHGLSVAQMPSESDRGISVETILMHSSGQWIGNQFTMPVTKADAQGVGSAITYARRYALAAMVGVAPEDDDGNAASGKTEGKINHKTGEIKPALITPNDGAMQSISAKERNDAVNIAADILGFWKEGRSEEAYSEFYEKDLSNEMQMAVWSILKPQSALRTELTKIRNIKKEV